MPVGGCDAVAGKYHRAAQPSRVGEVERRVLLLKLQGRLAPVLRELEAVRRTGLGAGRDVERLVIVLSIGWLEPELPIFAGDEIGRRLEFRTACGAAA